MTKKKRVEKDIIPPPIFEKSKGPVTLGRSTFIDEIIRKAESQSSVGPRTISTRNPTVTFQVAGSPSVADVEIHSKIEGSKQSFQNTENLQPNPLQEGNSCNLCEGEGEIGSAKKIKSSKPKSPEVVVKQRTPSILDQGSAVKIILKVSSEPPINWLYGHPLILGRPWLATTDAYIGCRTGSMTITRGNAVKNLA